jgi:hypothetical protein
MTHAEVVERAARWLRAKYPVVMTELVAASAEIPDALGIDTIRSTLVECKVSRADFRRDRDKCCRRRAEAHTEDSKAVHGTGLGLYRYFMAEPGVIPVNELPKGWGLLEIHGQRVLTKVKSGQFRRDTYSEMALLISALRRLGGTPGVESISVKVYTHQTKCSATLSVEPEDGDFSQTSVSDAHDATLIPATGGLP